ncbi:hypothetical protein Leryth_011867 [Lithospermum erythrorhizon]|nr:hypothetical protein Leryth_011867 [Lithospermum erythrorhizon]
MTEKFSFSLKYIQKATLMLGCICICSQSFMTNNQL